MRRILIENARAKNAKRGGNHSRVELDDQVPEIASPYTDFDDLLELNDARDKLAQVHPGKPSS
jgi:hypothetical protein